MMGETSSSTPVTSVGLVVAMEAELQHFLAGAAIDRIDTSGPWRDQHLTVEGVPVVALCSGIGMVNAAAATEHLIASHLPRAIFNFGCAGAHRRDLLPGDVVIGAETVHHGAMHILSTGEEYFPDRTYEVSGETVASTELPTDAALRELAHQAAAGWSPAPWPRDLPWPDGVAYREPVVEVGVVASADVWTQFHERLERLHARHRSLCEDMEAAAINQICARHGVPFLTIKDISNNEFHTLTDLQGDIEALPPAEIGKRAAALMIRVLGSLAASG